MPEMAEELQPELDQLFDKEKNPFTENQVRSPPNRDAT